MKWLFVIEQKQIVWNRLLRNEDGMRKRMLIKSVLASAFLAMVLGGCAAAGSSGAGVAGTPQNPESRVQEQSGTQGQDGTRGQDGTQEQDGTREQDGARPAESGGRLPEELDGLAVRDRTALTCFADKETSLRNSNLMNQGYLTSDDAGQVYFSDMNRGGIYVCGARGEEVRKLSGESGWGLQTAGEWLYFNSWEDGIRRLNRTTGETETVYGKKCGEFMVVGDRIYINGPEGFCTTAWDGSDLQILHGESMELTALTTGDRFWLGNSINGSDTEWFFKGYLLGYEEDTDELCLVGKGAIYPLLAGNWLSVFDVNTWSRHVWDLEKGGDVDLGARAQRAASDGENLYYAERVGEQFAVCMWDGTQIRELLSVEAQWLEYLYLSPDMIYFLKTVDTDGTATHEWWYYDPATSGFGKIW